MDIFAEQDAAYQKSVFPEGAPVISVEAAATTGWAKYAHYTIGIDSFGKSAPYKKVYEYFGITADAIAAKSTKLVAHFQGKAVPWLVDVPNLAGL